MVVKQKMINTDDLNEGDKVMVYLASDDSEEIIGIAVCIFKNGVFVNVEDNVHHGEIYASSVAEYIKLK